MAIETRVRKDGKKSYRVRISRTHPVTGKRQNITVGTYDLWGQAQRAERKALTELESGALIDRSQIDVATLLDMWLRAKAGEVRANTIVDYETTIRLHLMPALGHVKVQQLTALQVQDQFDTMREQHEMYTIALDAWKVYNEAWKKTRRRINRGPKPPRPDLPTGAGPRQLQNCFLRLSQALDFAVRMGIVQANVCKSLKRPSAESGEMETWTEDEAFAFLHAAQNRPLINRGGDTGLRYIDPLHPLWHFLVMEGMRRSEGHCIVLPFVGTGWVPRSGPRNDPIAPGGHSRDPRPGVAPGVPEPA